MRKYVQGLALFAAGTIAGHFFSRPEPVQAQSPEAPLTGIRLNHVGIYAKDWDETMRFYTGTLGFKEAFTFRDKDGNVTTSYLQMSKDNFFEIARATPERPAGINHVGIQVDDIQATVAALRRRGVKVADSRTGNSKAPLTSITDPNGIRLELVEFTPESLQRKALDSWK